ncbi:MAG: outer membrane protein assembly factor BamA [Syntrophobacterales bacterium]|nr:outer membrane protein assembly factor BamA [Syntrophobacterales bacterium]
MNKKRLLKRVFLFFGVALVFLLGQSAQAKEPQKIALLPFFVNAPSDAELLREQVFNGLLRTFQRDLTVQVVNIPQELAGDAAEELPSEARAMSIGKTMGVDYVIGGTISRFGEVTSVDIRIYDIDKGKIIPGFSIQSRRTEDFPATVQQVKTTILAKIGAVQRISRIEFKGNRRIGATAIEQRIKTERGGIYQPDVLSEDIHAIYKMGYFDDVQVDVEDSPEGKIVVFLLQEKALVSEIIIKGNKAVSTGDIEGLLTVKIRQTLNTEKLMDDLEKIRILYDSKGYYDVDVKEEISGEKEVRLVINIRENNRLHIRNISFDGNQSFTNRELRRVMTTQEKGLFSFMSDAGLLKREQLKQDINKIKVFYMNNGFLNAQLGEADITRDKKGIYIKIPVVEGRQYRIGKIDIAGDSLKVSNEKLLAGLKKRSGDIFDRSAIVRDIDSLTQACNDEGYANAEVVPLTRVHEQEKLVDVTYQMTTHQQVYFNRINIFGNDRTRDKVIRRQLSIVEGDLYSKSNIKQSYDDISRLRYFEEVDFQAEKGPDETLTDVTIRVKEKPTGMFSIGAGYSATDSAVLTAQISQQNLFGRGQTLSLKGTLGAKVTNVDLSFVEPWLFDIPLWMKSDIWAVDREYDEYDLDSKGFGLTFGYPLWERFFGYAGYRLSDDKIRNVSTWASQDIKNAEGRTVMSGVTLTLVRDSTDDNMFPSSGSKNTASVEYVGGALGGDAKFIKYMFTSAWFFPLPFDTVFSSRGRIGYIQETGDSEDLPDYERFVLGGINSLRGLRKVGPRYHDSDDVKGGIRMLNFNFDYIFPLIQSAGMKGVVFFDTGNAWNSGYDLGDMRRTAGLGIRWYSPIGPLRLEWGYVLDKKFDESPSRWEFSVGMFM